MKIRELLKIQEATEGRATPCDMTENDYWYYSESKDTMIKLLDMDLIHLIRVARKELTLLTEEEVEEINDKTEISMVTRAERQMTAGRE